MAYKYYYVGICMYNKFLGTMVPVVPGNKHALAFLNVIVILLMTSSS